MLKRIFMICLCFMFFGFNSVFVGYAYGESFYCDDGYSGAGGTETYHREEILFDRYEEDLVHLSLLCPEYDSAIYSNGCAPTAGTIVIGYYDVTLPNLIPNFEPGAFYEGVYYFRGLTDKVVDAMEEIASLMGTNQIQPGTSINQFKIGLSNYVKKQGYNITYSSVGSPLNISTAKNFFNLQQPIVLFLNSYDYYSFIGFDMFENRFSIGGRTKVAGHVVVAYGYTEFSFYDESGKLFRKEKFLIVSFGDSTGGYLSINSTACIDDAYAINIY